MAEEQGTVRYAVVGLGWIAQVAILPAFANATRNSRLAAVVSGTAAKLDALSERYGLEHALGYDELERLAEEDIADAVFLATPNHLHEEYTVRAAEAGLHVLCEKPMATSAAACRRMIEACAAADVRLMIAYRLHVEPATLDTLQLVREGTLGEPRVVTALNTQRVRAGDVRLEPVEEGGGALLDMGIYCINAARHLFGDEPIEVWATAGRRGGRRFQHVPAEITGTLRFPGDRLATFATSFDAAPVNALRVLGTEGSLQLDPAFTFEDSRTLRWTVDGEEQSGHYPASDHFGPELLYFSDCVLQGGEPQPGGHEGLNDVLIIEALHRSMDTGTPQAVDLEAPPERPDPASVRRCPPVETPEMVAEEEPGM